MAEEQTKEQQLKAARSDYDRWLSTYQEAQKGLQEARRKMNKMGIFPKPPEGIRFGLPDERTGLVHKCSVGLGEDKIKLYLKTGTYSNGELGELFLNGDKQGSFVSGLMDTFATMFSPASSRVGIPRTTRYGDAPV
jgi:ribonucleoside-diphosphate reductase alpha chain